MVTLQLHRLLQQSFSSSMSCLFKVYHHFIMMQQFYLYFFVWKLVLNISIIDAEMWKRGLCAWFNLYCICVLQWHLFITTFICSGNTSLQTLHLGFFSWPGSTLENIQFHYECILLFFEAKCLYLCSVFTHFVLSSLKVVQHYLMQQGLSLPFYSMQIIRGKIVRGKTMKKKNYVAAWSLRRRIACLMRIKSWCPAFTTWTVLR